MKKYPIHDKKPSEMFLNSLSGGGQRSIECGCGRMHYATLCEDEFVEINEGEDTYSDYLYREARDHQKNNPDGVIIETEYSSIGYKELNGQLWVDECPCNRLSIYEIFIWADKNSIRKYLKDRIDDEYRLAQEQLTLNVLAGIK